MVKTRLALKVVLLGAAAGAALVAGAGTAAGGDTPPHAEADALFSQLTAALDAFERGEQWKEADSGTLAWGCGQQLRTLVCLFEANGDRQWLDRLFRYADAMVANLTPNRDGFSSWRTRRYSPQADKDFDFAVHDGVILTPLCRAVELVKKRKDLAACGPRADKLLAVIETQLIPKWDKYRRRVDDGAVLVFPDDPALEVERGITLPHNQYLALGTAEVALFRITGKAVYRDHAAGFARFFKSRLRLVGDRYEWNYWDPSGAWDDELRKTDHPRAEDTGHGSLDLAFVLACADAGIVFDETDLRRFARAFTGAMWNGSLDAPVVGGSVNSPEPSPQSANVQDWLLLGRLEPRVRQVCDRVVPAGGSLAAKAQLYALWAAERRPR